MCADKPNCQCSVNSAEYAYALIMVDLSGTRPEPHRSANTTRILPMTVIGVLVFVAGRVFECPVSMQGQLFTRLAHILTEQKLCGAYNKVRAHKLIEVIQESAYASQSFSGNFYQGQKAPWGAGAGFLQTGCATKNSWFLWLQRRRIWGPSWSTERDPQRMETDEKSTARGGSRPGVRALRGTDLRLAYARRGALNARCEMGCRDGSTSGSRG